MFLYETNYTLDPPEAIITGCTPSGYTKDLIIPETIGGCLVTIIEACAFDSDIRNGPAFGKISIPGSVKTVRGYAFYNRCAEVVELKNGIERIFDAAFANNSSLKSITIPDSVRTIGADVFSGCNDLERAILSNNIKLVNSYAFKNCSSLKEVRLGRNTECIGVGAFENCTALETVFIPNSTKKISSGAFRNCSSLETVVIPDSVTNINFNSFYDCPNLTIKCNPGSYAEKYANNYNILTKPIMSNLDRLLENTASDIHGSVSLIVEER